MTKLTCVLLASLLLTSVNANSPRRVLPVGGCGNGIREVGEACDDGNYNSNDGCNNCKVSTGWTCNQAVGAKLCSCYETCGDGIRIGSSGCDDGNTKSGDGCSSTCGVELGWSCSGGSATCKDTCKEVCGDGRDFGTLGCDDGNNKNGDGCDKNCKEETGWKCTGGSPILQSHLINLTKKYFFFKEQN